MADGGMRDAWMDMRRVRRERIESGYEFFVSWGV